MADKVMRPGPAPKRKGIEHTGKGMVAGPSKTQLQPFNKKSSKK